MPALRQALNVSGHLMKTLLTLWMFLIFGQNCFAQIDRIDSLINQLDNFQVGLNGDYSGPTIDLRGEPSISIYNIGRSATEKLIAILEDSSKGIISHILLTWIWNKSHSLKTVFSDQGNLSVYTYNDLNFFVRPGRIYANGYDLRLNRLNWETFIRQNGR